eukprot:s3538_g2.t1
MTSVMTRPRSHTGPAMEDSSAPKLHPVAERGGSGLRRSVRVATTVRNGNVAAVKMTSVSSKMGHSEGSVGK